MVASVKEKYTTLARIMDERLKRRWAACEAMAIGRGGVSTLARATGMSRTTITKGIAEIQEQFPELAERVDPSNHQRVRAPGGGRRRSADKDESLLDDLKALVDPTTRGDPASPLLWTSKSTRTLAKELRRRGHSVSHATVGGLLRELGYRLQANQKTKEGTDHPDRDRQFQHISGKARDFQSRGEPVISVDTKKRELVGDFKNGGREWHPKGEPERVRTHDFRDDDLGVAIPYGVYDVTQDTGWVNVGIDRDTPEFAVESIRRWWYGMGRGVYPEARELLITADAGGSNGPRPRLWKRCLQDLANELGLRISVCHLPPGTSKWNKIEHRMFCHIAQNWRGRPLVSRAVIVNLIGSTKTQTGLTVEAALDSNEYASGVQVSDQEIASIRIQRDTFHGEWNYTIEPNR